MNSPLKGNDGLLVERLRKIAELHARQLTAVKKLGDGSEADEKCIADTRADQTTVWQAADRIEQLSDLREALVDLMDAVNRDAEGEFGIGGLTTIAMLRAHRALSSATGEEK